MFALLSAVFGSATSQAATERSVAEVAEAESAATGFETYRQYCARCHGQGGEGVPGSYPSLRIVDWQNRAGLLYRVLEGCPSPIDELESPMCMPAHGFLSNETAAAALTFLLQHWGPGGEPFTTEEVAKARLSLLGGHASSYPAIPGTSPLADLDAVQYVTSDGPPLSVAEFERATSLFYGRCTACHGVLREGTAGSPLSPDIMRAVGTEYLREVIGFGSSTGMPAWGSTEQLSAEDIHLLARFLQHPVSQPPDLNEADIRDSWNLIKSVDQRPAGIAHDYELDRMFVVTLHDVAQVMLIDGASRSVITTIKTGRGPHRVRASASGRYLYVICRDGTLTQIDLYAAPPEAVADVRIGFEARAVGASRHPDFADRFVLAGAYWPPHLVLLNGKTLEPLRVISTRSRSVRSQRYHPEPRVSDVAGSRTRPEFIAHIKETGHSYLFPYDDARRLQIVDLDASADLRVGTFAATENGRYFITPADSNAISVLDTQQQKIVAEIPARVFGGGTGVTIEHPEHGPLWLVSTMVTSTLTGIGVDPQRHPDKAWRSLLTLEGPGMGSMFLATHPQSSHLWMDTPLNSDREISQSIAVFDKKKLADGFQTLPIASWSGVVAASAQSPSRVLKPTYDALGQEVWTIVWNPQDQNSAIVIVDDEKLEPVAVIDDSRLITPTRIYNVAHLRSGN